MTDYFALLDEPRRPWLDPDQLRQKFLNLSTRVHPDRTHSLAEGERKKAQDTYAEFNAAYTCLRAPKDRLRHLLELELGRNPDDIQRIPSAMMELMLEIGQACRATDVFLEEREKLKSPLLKVKSFEHSQAETEKLSGIQQRIGAQRGLVIAAVKEIDEQWEATHSPNSNARVDPLSRLEESYRLLSYFDRWIGQIQERLVRLSF